MNFTSTVCIPTRFEREDYLMSLLDSILNQTKLPTKILFVSDKDQLEEKFKIINKIKNRIKDICLYEFIESNKNGLANARNTGIDNCNTEVLFFSDDDDIWHPEKIEIVIKCIQEEGKCLISHYFNIIKKNNSISMHFRYKPKPNYLMTGFSNFIGGGSSFCGSLSVFETLRFNDYRFSEDWDFWIRALLSEVKIIRIKKSLVSYRYHSNNLTKNKFSIYLLETKIRFKLFVKLFLILLGSFLGFFYYSSKNLILIIFRIIKLVK